jgi:hypothetical protein
MVASSLIGLTEALLPEQVGHFAHQPIRDHDRPPVLKRHPDHQRDQVKRHRGDDQPDPSGCVPHPKEE